MAHIHQSVEIDVLVPVAYRQWTQFEKFPEFMEHVEEVRRLDDTHLRWRGTLGTKPVDWEIEITERIPERSIGWRNPAAPGTFGAITFEPVRQGCTRLTVDLEYESETPEEKAADSLGLVAAQIEDELDHFKAFVEAQGKYTGGPDPNSVSPA